MPIVILLAGLVLAAVILRISARLLYKTELSLSRALGVSAVALLLARIVTLAAAFAAAAPGQAPSLPVQVAAMIGAMAAMGLAYGFGIQRNDGSALGYPRGLLLAAILVAVAWLWYLVMYAIGAAFAGQPPPPGP